MRPTDIKGLFFPPLLQIAQEIPLLPHFQAWALMKLLLLLTKGTPTALPTSNIRSASLSNKGFHTAICGVIIVIKIIFITILISPTQYTILNSNEQFRKFILNQIRIIIYCSEMNQYLTDNLLSISDDNPIIVANSFNFCTDVFLLD